MIPKRINMIQVKFGDKEIKLKFVHLIILFVLVFIFFEFSNTGKELMRKEEPSTVYNTNYTNYTYNTYNTNLTIRNLTIRNKEIESEVLEVFKKINNLSYKKMIDNKPKNIFTLIGQERQNNYEDIFIDNAKQIKRFGLFEKMKIHSPQIIHIGVKNVLDDFKQNQYTQDFLSANLDKLKKNLKEEFKIIKDSNDNKYYAEQKMIESLSNYIDYEPINALQSFNEAKKVYPYLTIFKELEKEYKDIQTQDSKELKYAYVLISSVNKNLHNMNITADRIIGLGNAKKIRKSKYKLYLDVTSNEVRVYTIIEHFDEKDLHNQIQKINNFIISPSPFKLDTTIPKEYILSKKRKKIFIFDSSKNGNDKLFAKKLKKFNFQNILPKGQWKKTFGMYAIYYDGNSYDKNDLNKVLGATRNIIDSSVVNSFAYQQSNGEKIQSIFKNNDDLKYLIILKEI
jgi:hypothetical protein